MAITIIIIIIKNKSNRINLLSLAKKKKGKRKFDKIDWINCDAFVRLDYNLEENIQNEIKLEDIIMKFENLFR